MLIARCQRHFCAKPPLKDSYVASHDFLDISENFPINFVFLGVSSSSLDRQ